MTPFYLKFSVDNRMFETDKQFLLGEDIKKMAHVPLEFDLYLVIPGFQDELIENETKVNMARPGIERFVARKSKHTITIIVNGQPKPYDEDKVSYEQIVKIAFPNHAPGTERGYTVSYANGPQQNVEGVMSRHSVVFVKHNMKFDVTPTHRS